jgi:hypothetical protein
MWVTGLFVVMLEARASEPPPIAPTAGADGFWHTELLVPVPLADVKAALVDPISAARFSGDITKISYVTRSSPCPTLFVETAGIASVSYEYRRCTTSTGWHETLVSSTTLDAYEVRWSLAPAPDGTLVSYSIKIDPALPAPEFMLARAMKSSITRLLGRFYSTLTGKSAATE